MSAYLKLSTMEYPRFPGDVEADPDGATAYVLVQDDPVPTFRPDREHILYGTPENRDGTWYNPWRISKFPDSDGIINVRAKRNDLLVMSDWTQLADAPVTAEQKAAWATYRQALRDVPQQAGFPWDVVWPTKPV